jgi:uncharacterized alkaline shock family protein YloU
MAERIQPTPAATGTELSDDVLYGIAQLALETIDGLRLLSPPARVGELLTGRRTKGIRVERTDRGVRVQLNVRVQYGLVIPEVAQAAQSAVRDAMHSMTGLDVEHVNLTVVGIDLEKPAKLHE